MIINYKIIFISLIIFLCKKCLTYMLFLISSHAQIKWKLRYDYISSHDFEKKSVFGGFDFLAYIYLVSFIRRIRTERQSIKWVKKKKPCWFPLCCSMLLGEFNNFQTENSYYRTGIPGRNAKWVLHSWALSSLDISHFLPNLFPSKLIFSFIHFTVLLLHSLSIS